MWSTRWAFLTAVKVLIPDVNGTLCSNFTFTQKLGERRRVWSLMETFLHSSAVIAVTLWRGWYHGRRQTNSSQVFVSSLTGEETWHPCGLPLTPPCSLIGFFGSALDLYCCCLSISCWHWIIQPWLICQVDRESWGELAVGSPSDLCVV